MIAVIDYGVGNLFSLRSSFKEIGETAVVTCDEKEIAAADRIILPGVGAFGDAAKKLKETGMQDIVLREAAAGKPLMGICLGMQLLFEKSYEYGEHEGLGLIGGSVRPMQEFIDPAAKIPQIGWNSLHFVKSSPLFKYLREGDYVYFVHSYSGRDCSDSLLAVTDYGGEVTAAVGKNNIYGCQFHPEKSGTVGLKILKAFCEL